MTQGWTSSPATSLAAPFFEASPSGDALVYAGMGGLLAGNSCDPHRLSHFARTNLLCMGPFPVSR